MPRCSRPSTHIVLRHSPHPAVASVNFRSKRRPASISALRDDERQLLQQASACANSRTLRWPAPISPASDNRRHHPRLVVTSDGLRCSVDGRRPHERTTGSTSFLSAKRCRRRPIGGRFPKKKPKSSQEESRRPTREFFPNHSPTRADLKAGRVLPSDRGLIPASLQRYSPEPIVWAWNPYRRGVSTPTCVSVEAIQHGLGWSQSPLPAGDPCGHPKSADFFGRIIGESYAPLRMCLYS